jgi:hypothetical protein
VVEIQGNTLHQVDFACRMWVRFGIDLSPKGAERLIRARCILFLHWPNYLYHPCTCIP